MKKILIASFLLLANLTAWAQTSKRIEIPLVGNDLESFSIPIGNQGLILISQLNKQSFSIQKFNTDLEQVWTRNGNLDSNLDYVTHSFDGTILSLLFSRFRSNSYIVFRLNVQDGSLTKYQIYSVDRIEISNFRL